MLAAAAAAAEFQISPLVVVVAAVSLKIKPFSRVVATALWWVQAEDPAPQDKTPAHLGKLPVVVAWAEEAVPTMAALVAAAFGILPEAHLRVVVMQAVEVTLLTPAIPRIVAAVEVVVLVLPGQPVDGA